MKRDELVCLKCTLPICDELAESCLYAVTTGKNKRSRQNASGARNALRQVNERRAAIAALGFRKYDGRVRPGSDPLQRLVWREQYQARKERSVQSN